MKRIDLETYLNSFLQVHLYQDYGPNGLQVEGKEEIKKVVFAVSATIESIHYAIHHKADALIVHHGLFWKHAGPRPIINQFANRIKPLIKNDLNLFAYHLPLDGNQDVGNAHGLAKRIGLQNLKPFGDYYKMPIGIQGEFAEEITDQELQLKLEKILGHQVITTRGKDQKLIRTIGIITGGANNDWYKALDANLDAYLTGEISEYNWHDAREAGITFMAGGHNATEQFGVQDLMAHLQNKFGLEATYFASENPA